MLATASSLGRPRVACARVRGCVAPDNAGPMVSQRGIGCGESVDLFVCRRADVTASPPRYRRAPVLLLFSLHWGTGPGTPLSTLDRAPVGSSVEGCGSGAGGGRIGGALAMSSGRLAPRGFPDASEAARDRRSGMLCAVTTNRDRVNTFPIGPVISSVVRPYAWRCLLCLAGIRPRGSPLDR